MKRETCDDLPKTCSGRRWGRGESRTGGQGREKRLGHRRGTWSSWPHVPQGLGGAESALALKGETGTCQGVGGENENQGRESLLQLP